MQRFRLLGSVALCTGITFFQLGAAQPGKDPLEEAAESLAKAKATAIPDRTLKPVETTSEAARSLVGTTWGGWRSWQDEKDGTWRPISGGNFLMTFHADGRLLLLLGSTETAYDPVTKRDAMPIPELVKEQGTWTEIESGVIEVQLPDRVAGTVRFRPSETRRETSSVYRAGGEKGLLMSSAPQKGPSTTLRVDLERDLGLYYAYDFVAGNNWRFWDPSRASELQASSRFTAGPVK